MYDPTKPYKNEILKLIQTTWKTSHISVKNHILKKKFSYPEYHHSDGIGTKGIYHWKERSFKNAVLDALAMNLNDFLMVGAKPYAILNHLFLPRDDRRAVLEIINHLSRECKKRKIAIFGGETAIHNDMEGMELSITMLGFVKKPRQNEFKIGNVLIGIESNGLHSNGFTKIREIFGNKYRQEFIAPTSIYFDEISPLIKKYEIHGIAHITGGAFTKLKGLLKKADAYLKISHKLKPQPIYYAIKKRGVSEAEMYKIFNCGIGLILSAKKEDVKKILRAIRRFKTDIMGEIIPGNEKVIVESAFSNRKLIL